jgi:hypothetical protein
MPRTENFAERIGAVFLPESDTIEGAEDFTPSPEGPLPGPLPPFPEPLLPKPRLNIPWPPEPFPFPPLSRFCYTALKQGCYTVSFVPTGTPIFGTRYRGTLRVEHAATGLRISGDLYTYRLLDDLVVKFPEPVLGRFEFIRGDLPVTGEAADTGGTIPIYRRRSYYSYLKGTGARLFSFVPKGVECSFTLNFDEFVYNHPATGFSGSFNNAPTRSLRYVLKKTSTPDLYTGEAYVGSTKIGTVSIRWISDFYRRTQVQLHTLQGANAPPASVGTSTMASIFADVGWELTFTDGGTIQLPPALASVNINACWSSANLHTLMSSVPGYNPADLDSVWRVHLVAVPATLNAPPNQCGRGVMFDSSLGADPNAVPREGSATFSHDGYPFAEVPDGLGGSHYDGAANQQQRNVPRAYLRSATHEVGHAFNQIHQGFEGGNDNSIMTPTPGVATVLGLGGTFPDQINLGFNDRVKKHLRHLPDPAVRPGAMDFFGSAVAAPEVSDVAWLEEAELRIDLSSDRVALGEPVTLGFELVNVGATRLPAPEELDTESLTVRVNVTDPTGRITFMRPERVKTCPRIAIGALEPNASLSGSTTLFWGRDGFAFETPGRHVVEVIVLWDVAGVPVAAVGERDVYVTHPVSPEDNDVAALMLHPEVGAAVASGDVSAFERAAERIKQASDAAKDHPAVSALDRLGLLEKPKPKPRPKRGGATRGGRKRAS